ncbi:ribosomal protein S5 domain 2-type protein [Geranomyces variabilis]|nr:ribosomal protein S5 domain 2-type protein [Geranomyces variabilis]
MSPDSDPPRQPPHSASSALDNVEHPAGSQTKRPLSPGPVTAAADQPAKRPKAAPPPPSGDIRKFLPNFVPAKLFASRKIEDRGSVFIAYAAEVRSLQDVGRMTKAIRAEPATRGAAHHMVAYRFLDLKPGRTGLAGPDDFHTVSGNDDDGERYGSERMIRLMAKYDAIDVLVVVSRVWGGENLGPVRFTHIENVTHDALKKGGFIGAPPAGAGAAQPALSALLSAFEQEQAVKKLREKDAVIKSLREQLRAAESQTSSPASRPSSQTTTDYGAMNAEKAQRLLKARENTIKLLAKKMDALAD